MNVEKMSRIEYEKISNANKVNKTTRTNLEKIRAMTAEELAEFLADTLDHCSAGDCEGCPLTFSLNCEKEFLLDWLNKEED